jgi:hypothetical protein
MSDRWWRGRLGISLPNRPSSRCNEWSTYSRSWLWVSNTGLCRLALFPLVLRVNLETWSFLGLQSSRGLYNIAVKTVRIREIEKASDTYSATLEE